MKLVVALEMTVAGTVTMELTEVEGVPSDEDSFHIQVERTAVQPTKREFTIICPPSQPLDVAAMELLQDRRVRLGHVATLQIAGALVEYFEKNLQTVDVSKLPDETEPPPTQGKATA